MRDVNLKIAPGGKLAESAGIARGEGYTVLDVPDDVSVSDVILQMSKVVIMPLRSQAVPWSALTRKAQGAIINMAPFLLPIENNLKNVLTAFM